MDAADLPKKPVVRALKAKAQAVHARLAVDPAFFTRQASGVGLHGDLRVREDLETCTEKSENGSDLVFGY